MNLPNIHSVRKSFKAVCGLLNSSVDNARYRGDIHVVAYTQSYLPPFRERISLKRLFSLLQFSFCPGIDALDELLVFVAGVGLSGGKRSPKRSTGLGSLQ